MLYEVITGRFDITVAVQAEGMVHAGVQQVIGLVVILHQHGIHVRSAGGMSGGLLDII